MRIRGSARGCWGALVILRELPDLGSEWFPSNVARNSHACILGFEIRSLELQRLWPISKNDRIKLRATFGGVVTSVTFGPLCQAPPLHRPRPSVGPAPSLAAPSQALLLRTSRDAGEAGPRRVPPQCCRGQAADAPGSSYTYAELTTSRGERCCLASGWSIGEHTRQRVRELIRTLLSVPQGIDAVVARGFCH